MTPFWPSMFKTMFRQPARSQHKKVTDSYVVHLLTAIFDDFGSSLLLYFGGAGVYRRRWDFLLRVLQIPKRVALTPGGLQGGGAVHAYRSNLDLPSLLWPVCGDVRSLPARNGSSDSFISGAVERPATHSVRGCNNAF